MDNSNIGSLLGKYVRFCQPGEKGTLYGKITSVVKRDDFWHVNVKGLHKPKYSKPTYHLPPDIVHICDQKEMFMLGAKYGKK